LIEKEYNTSQYINNMKVLVTGGTGSLGSVLVEDLLKKKYEVNVFARTKYESSSQNLHPFTGDITDKETAKEAVKGCEIIYHLAGLLSYSSPYQELYASNYLGTKNILEAAIEGGANRFIYCSTVGVIGDIQKMPVDEAHPCNPDNNYSKTKYLAEQLVFENQDKIEVCAIRPAPIYGPKSKLFSELIKNIHLGKLSYIGTGGNKAHMANVHNVSYALQLAALRKSAAGNKFIIADSEIKTAKEIYELLAKLLGISPKPPIPYWKAYLAALYYEANQKISGKQPKLSRAYLKILTRDREYSIEKAKRVIDYHPRIGLEEGLKETVDWCKQEKII